MEKQRTLQQNKSLHVYFSEVARELNNQGITVDVLLQNMEVDISEHLVKDMFREIGRKKFGKTSTAHLTTKELQECWEEINRHLAPLEIHVPYPSQSGLEMVRYYSNEENKTQETK